VLADQRRDSSLSQLNVEQVLRHHEECIHTRIKQDETIRANEIDPTSTRLATKQEYELFTLGIVELIHQFLPFADGHAPVESEAAIPEPKSVKKNTERPTA
jgi:hypothetical protein